MARSDVSSPARKRMRLSSPTYDANVEDLDADGLDELDRIEFTLSQQAPSNSQKQLRPSQEISQDAKQKRLKAIMLTTQSSMIDGVGDSGLNERRVVNGKRGREEGRGFESSAMLARQVRSTNVKYDHGLSSSPEEPPLEPDYSKWFEPAPELSASAMGFQRVSKDLLASTPADDPADQPSGFMSASKSFSGAGFASASNMQKAVLEPSKAALEFAAKKMKDWAEEVESELQASAAAQPSPSKPALALARPVLASVVNTPPPKPNIAARSISTPNLARPAGTDRVRTFKSPLMGQPSPRAVYPKAGGSTSPSKVGGVHVSRSSRPHPLASTPITNSTPGASAEQPSRSISESSLPQTTPVRPNNPHVLGSTKHAHKAGFSTPFKQGMKPGEPGRAALEKVQQSQRTGPVSAQKTPAKRSDHDRPKRLSLKDSGLLPQRHTAGELELMGVNVAELSQINTETANFYVFYTSASHSPSTQTQRTSGTSLGPAEAYAHLLKTGRTLASRAWVDNHWALILWKLASLACLEPQRERTPDRRWCWRSVLAQLEARYDRELEGGSRPPLRLITAQDAPAGSPLVLVVTRVLWMQPARLADNGRVVEDAAAELEVSDGWYRLRASVDAPLARAVCRGTIKPGRKIAVAGAKLENDKKEPSEILQAYDACTLLLSGNGTHLAPWHAKLGFQAEPFIATLGSLTPDGGSVPLVDFIIEKTYPVAFLEFVSSPDGKKTPQGPRSEAEETEIEDQWRKRRDTEESKLRDELSARWGRWEGFTDRLENAAGGRFRPSEDDMPPDHIDDLFDELDALPPGEVGAFVRNLSPDECGWLARFLKRKTDLDKELAGEEIELEMRHKSPPRDVRNFRIVVVRDARTHRRPAHRLAQLTLWDVLQLCVSEGALPGAIEVGQRFLMTSLVPTQHRAWMGRKKDDTVYLASRRDSRFIRLK